MNHELRKPSVVLAFLIAAVVGFAGISAASEAGDKDQQKQDQSKAEVEQQAEAEARPVGGDASVPRTRSTLPKKKGKVVITNDDLERMFGRSRVSATPPANARKPSSSTASSAATAATTEQPAARQSRAEQVAKARELEQQIQRLRKNISAMRNPYLAPPKQTEEEKNAQQGLDNRQRIAQTEKQIQELEQQLAKLRSGGAN